MTRGRDRIIPPHTVEAARREGEQVWLMRWILFGLIVVAWLSTLVVLLLSPAMSEALGATGTSGLVGVLARYLFTRES